LAFWGLGGSAERLNASVRRSDRARSQVAWLRPEKAETGLALLRLGQHRSDLVKNRESLLLQGLQRRVLGGPNIFLYLLDLLP